MPFFTDPFLARSLCFSGQPQDARSSVNAPIKLKTLALFLDCFFFFFLNRVSCFHVKIALSKCSLYNTVCHSVANQGYCAVQGHFNMASIRTVPYQPSFDWLFSHKKRKNIKVNKKKWQHTQHPLDSWSLKLLDSKKD